MNYAVLTAIGTDRVGIVDDISGEVARLGGNIEESRMAVLGGEFAVIMLTAAAPEALDALDAELQALGKRLDLHLQLRRTRPPREAPAGRPYALQTVSQDTPGIVHSVTAVLRRYGINIEDLETDTARAPWTGAPMFHMRAHLVIPPTVVISQLREELVALQERQDLDIEFHPVYPLTE